MNDGKMTLRAGLWYAYGKRCFFCQEPLPYRDLEIDHLIARKERDDHQQLVELLANLDLSADFDLDNPRNLVPSHHDCNGRKSAARFSAGSLRFYLELTQKNLPLVEREIQRLRAQATRDNLVAQLSIGFENGVLSEEDVVLVLRNATRNDDQVVPEPLVFCVSANIIDLQDSGRLPQDAPVDYPYLCDWMEESLLATLRGIGSTIFVLCEPSQRNGETLSVRIAAWTIDLDALSATLPVWWEITELAYFSEIYQSKPDELLLRALDESVGEG